MSFSGYLTQLLHSSGKLQPGLEVIKVFSCSTQLSMKFVSAHKY